MIRLGSRELGVRFVASLEVALCLGIHDSRDGTDAGDRPEQAHLTAKQNADLIACFIRSQVDNLRECNFWNSCSSSTKTSPCLK